MAKYIKIGSVLSGKDDPKSTYIKIDQDISLKKGETLSVQSKTQASERLEAAIAAGKLSGEIAEKARARLEKWPSFVKFEIQVKRD